MEDNTNKPCNGSLLAIWNVAKINFLEDFGSLSIRVAEGAEKSVIDISGSYGTDAQLAENDIDIVQNIVGFVKSGNGCQNATDQHSSVADTITLADEYIITTATPNAIEFDLSIHRRHDALGTLSEKDDEFARVENSEVDLNDMAQSDMTLFNREPVAVSVHNESPSVPVQLHYTGSFYIESSEITSRLGLEEALILEDDEENGCLVCDIHKGPNGLQSITITRDAMTPDGPTRRIVYSDLKV